MESVREYAIFSMDPLGKIDTWNSGAERMLGYSEREVMGQRYQILFTKDDMEAGVPDQEMQAAVSLGRRDRRAMAPAQRREFLLGERSADARL